MKLNRRQFTKTAGTGSIALAIAWQQACSEVAESGEVSTETVEVLLDSQGSVSYTHLTLPTNREE